MRNRYIVTYDITDDRRREAVYKTMRGFGDHLQFSVFRCDLSEREVVDMTAAVHALIDHTQDQVLLVDLGPVDGRASSCISAIGRPYKNPERTVVIL
ncbi:MAG: CRISPR-associated endonuclease Cas2 [Deltaproteobacteria bacterium]|nr:CRISPR-associated endonuclease Cas2 [Kofleriaceae bacterium]